MKGVVSDRHKFLVQISTRSTINLHRQITINDRDISN